MVKFLITHCFLVIFIINANATNNATQQKKLEYAEHIIDTIFKTIKSSDNKDQKTFKTTKIIEQEIDFEWNAKLALGIKARSMKAEDFKKFVILYKELLCQNLVSKFSIAQHLSKEAISFENRTIRLNDTDDLITFFIESKRKSKIEVKMVITNTDLQNNKFKIMDIIIEGMSVAVAYRNQFSSYIDSHGIDSLNEHLKKMIEDNKSN